MTTTTADGGADRRPYQDATPTVKLFLVAEALDPGGQHIEQDGEYTITVQRAAAPQRPGWYLVATSAEPVPVYWTGAQWRQPQPRWLLDEPIVVNRLLTVNDVLAALDGGQADTAIATRLARIFG